MSELHLYQIIHTLDWRTDNLELYLEVLSRAYRDILGQKIELDATDIATKIEQLLSTERASRTMSVFVRLTLAQDGSTELQITDKSIYSGYTHRCVYPKATPQQVEFPYWLYPSTAIESTAILSRLKAQNLGVDICVEYNNLGEVNSANTAPLYGIRTNTIYIPQRIIPTVEMQLFETIARNSNYKVAYRPILLDELPILDELFMIDHYGITSIDKVGERRYTRSTAQRLAREMATIRP